MKIEKDKIYRVVYADRRDRVYYGRLAKDNSNLGNPFPEIGKMFVFDKCLRVEDGKLDGRFPLFFNNGKFFSLAGLEVEIRMADERDVSCLRD